MGKTTLKWIFFLQCQLLLLLAYVTEGFEGGADAICHWMISRDAFANPMLFLDQWNKPIFTIISTPFAQFGLLGMRFFSALTGIITGLVLYRIVKKKDHENWAWLPAIFLLFTPVYLPLLTSSMTEPLFGLFLTLFMFFVSKNKLGWAALIAGLSPFVRQEGIALVPVAAAVLIYVGQFRKVPLLFLGTIVLGLVGWLISGNVLWILTSFPYGSSSSEIYGSGTLFHFLRHLRELFGVPVSILFLIGAAFFMQTCFNRLKNRVQLVPFELAVLGGLAFSVIFFSAHSLVWWKGLSGSAGLVRVMACITPSVVLVSSYGFSRLVEFPLLNNELFKKLIVAVCIITSAVQLALVTSLPTRLDEPQIVMRQAANWLISKQPTEKVHYPDAVFSYFARDLNYDSPINKGVLDISQIGNLSDGEYIVWDSHFSQNEGRLPLDSLLFHPFLVKRKSFHERYSNHEHGGKPYVVHVFQKTKNAVTKELRSFDLVMENFDNYSNEFQLNKTLGRNRSKCVISNEENHFVTVKKRLNTEDFRDVINLEAEVWVRSDNPLVDEEFFLVSDVNVFGDTRQYLRTSSDGIAGFKVGEWNKMIQSFEPPQNLPDSFELKCYIWNPNGVQILVDDFSLKAKTLQLSYE